MTNQQPGYEAAFRQAAVADERVEFLTLKHPKYAHTRSTQLEEPTLAVDGIRIATTFSSSYLVFYANNDGSTGSQSLPLGAYASATRNIQYITRQTVTRYINTSRPTAGTYGLDIDTTPTVISSVIRAQGINADGSSGAASLSAAQTPRRMW